MKREDMEQIRALNQELETIREKYIRTPAEEVGDTYGDYRTGKKIVKVMHGYSTVKRDRLRDKMRRKEEQIRIALMEMEDFLDTISNAEIRDIFRLYYAVGMSLEEIGDRKGYDRSTIGKKIDRFWNRLEEEGPEV